MIYLDTHVVAWLYAGLVERFNQAVRGLLNAHEIRISPVVRLELQYLVEIGRIKASPDTIIADLSDRIGLRIDDHLFNAVVSRALGLTWTRDPFDRIIVATAELSDSILVSKDQVILMNYPNAKW